MQVRGPSAQQLSRIQVGTDQLVDMGGKFDRPEVVGMTTAGGHRMFGFAPGQCGFEKAAQRIERVMPRIALVFDKGVEHRDANEEIAIL